MHTTNFTDAQLKAAFLGEHIYDSLTDAAKRRLKPYRKSYEVEDREGNVVIDGATLFWQIATLVDPDNDHLIESVKRKLRTLHVKDFGYSAQKLMAEFQNLMEQIEDLGGDYGNDEKFLDFWTALKTMAEKEFNRFVKQLQDDWRMQPKATRPTLDVLMQKINAKEVAMIADGEWNVASKEQSQILALTNLLEWNQ